MLGPFQVQPIFPLICSLVGMVEKTNSMAMHCITYLSHPRGSSVNFFIASEDVETYYQSFQDGVQLVGCQGTGAFMAKEDFKSAFWNIPMHYQDLNLLGIKVQGQFFIDCALPFGASISCSIFEDVATLIHWLAEKEGRAQVHPLPGWFLHSTQVCHSLQTDNGKFQASVWWNQHTNSPWQIRRFLGLTLDTSLMVIRVAPEKLQDISAIISRMLKSRKVTSWKLQSLAGKFNFITKAVPASKCFIKWV